jgi:hypothetical protein
MEMCWVQAYFEKEGYFEHRPNFGEEQLAGKETCMRKRNMHEEKKHA